MKKEPTESWHCRFQKASLYGWAGGSLCTVIAEAWELTVLNQTVRRKDESEEAWQARQAKAIADINSHSLVLFHGLVQVQILYTFHTPFLQTQCMIGNLQASVSLSYIAVFSKQCGTVTGLDRCNMESNLAC